MALAGTPGERTPEARQRDPGMCVRNAGMRTRSSWRWKRISLPRCGRCRREEADRAADVTGRGRASTALPGLCALRARATSRAIPPIHARVQPDRSALAGHRDFCPRISTRSAALRDVPYTIGGAIVSGRRSCGACRPPGPQEARTDAPWPVARSSSSRVQTSAAPATSAAACPARRTTSPRTRPRRAASVASR